MFRARRRGNPVAVDRRGEKGRAVADQILITGGAGFIGSHVADALLAAGHRVRAFDCLDPRVHPDGRPGYLDADVELVLGDVRDAATVRRVLGRVDVVVHLAARVGAHESAFEPADYATTNTRGTGVLLQEMLERTPKRLVVASCASVYGEGLYRSPDGLFESAERTREQLLAGHWEPIGPDGAALEPLPTPEWKRPAPASIAAATKYAQERMCLLFGAAHGIPTVALRLASAYGPRQHDACAVGTIAARLRDGERPTIFEDGLQQRDFVSVHDVARAVRLALDRDSAAGHAINVGSGRGVTILELAEKLGEALGVQVEPHVTGESRSGDVRHCVTDITLAGEVLGYTPAISLDDGLAELAESLDAAPVTPTESAEEATL
jgi:dTDP-L-rhamnose 4-epimerase